MHKVKILFTQFVTHDVKRFIIEKPKGYKTNPGYATEISIDLPEFREKKNPFTFTSLNDDQILEFTIKRYDSHNGVTKKLHSLKPGDYLLIDDPWKTIEYKEKGVFIAGGAGITPFIAILRDLRQKNQILGNTLIFSNKTQKDIIIEREFEDMFKESPNNLILTLTEENDPNYENSRVDENFLKNKISDFDQNFYICGPPKMGSEIKDILTKLGSKTESISFE